MVDTIALDALWRHEGLEAGETPPQRVWGLALNDSVTDLSGAEPTRPAPRRDDQTADGKAEHTGARRFSPSEVLVEDETRKHRAFA